MSYIWNVYRYHIDANIQLCIYPMEKDETGQKLAAVGLRSFHNNEYSKLFTDHLRLVDAETDQEINAETDIVGNHKYVCSMDKSVHIFYRNKYIYTLESAAIWKTAKYNAFL